MRHLSNPQTSQLTPLMPLPTRKNVDTSCPHRVECAYAQLFAVGTGFEWRYLDLRSSRHLANYSKVDLQIRLSHCIRPLSRQNWQSFAGTREPKALRFIHHSVEMPVLRIHPT